MNQRQALITAHRALRDLIAKQETSDLATLYACVKITSERNHVSDSALWAYYNKRVELSNRR